jgi:glutamine phosphoribosylpyrophosphate amidotransferase
MCGIVGFSGIAEKDSRTKFIDLCRQSCIRGVHAFGIAYHTTDGVAVFKSTDFEEVIVAIPDPLPRKIIFHNRYSTSGDYRIMENNQPIFINGNALVFNGTVDMGTKAEMEARHGIKMQTDNDGEIVLLDVLAGKPFAHIRNSAATFAGVFLGKDGNMFAFRNDLRPLWCLNERGCKFICSTIDIAVRAKFDRNNCTPVEPLKLLYL